MPKGLSPDKELQAIEREREQLRKAHDDLQRRERTAREALLRQSNEMLAAAFAKGNYGAVSKAQSAELARLVATHGISLTLERLRP